VGDATATMHRVPDPVATPPPPAAPTSAAPAADESSSPVGPTLPVAPTLPDNDAGTWVVEPGDSLWSIAAEVVRGARPDAGDRDVSRFWQRLIEANRLELVDPDNPDLLLPGQQLVVPGFPA
jgi:resuscitation-promoting factor RpfA